MLHPFRIFTSSLRQAQPLRRLSGMPPAPRLTLFNGLSLRVKRLNDSSRKPGNCRKSTISSDVKKAPLNLHLHRDPTPSSCHGLQLMNFKALARLLLHQLRPLWVSSLLKLMQTMRHLNPSHQWLSFQTFYENASMLEIPTLLQYRSLSLHHQFSCPAQL